MSVTDDLSLNRAVFEKLTGNALAKQPETYSPAKRIQDIPAFDTEPRKKPLTFPIYDEPAETPEQVYSLTQKENIIQTGFTAPDGIAYPSLREQRRIVSPDPLESLYYQLEVEARRGSQLAGEDEFYG